MGGPRHPSIRCWLAIELAVPENPGASRLPSDLVADHAERYNLHATKTTYQALGKPSRFLSAARLLT